MQIHRYINYGRNNQQYCTWIPRRLMKIFFPRQLNFPNVRHYNPSRPWIKHCTSFYIDCIRLLYVILYFLTYIKRPRYNKTIVIVFRVCMQNNSKGSLHKRVNTRRQQSENTKTKREEAIKTDDRTNGPTIILSGSGA